MAPRLIITGFMGSGKSTVARELAGRLKWRLRDADDEIERRLGMTISEAFAIHGEPGFRAVEEETVCAILDDAAEAAIGTVIALGGGAVTSGKLRQRLKDERLVVYIDVDPETAFSRAADGSRPLAADPESFRQLFGQRQELYRSVATRTVDSRGADIGELCERIIEIIREDGREEGHDQA